jgi:hypothetical protein
VIRTVWLGFAFLIVLAGAGSFRFAFGHFDAANASGIVRTEVDRAAGRKSAQEAFTNTEWPRVGYVPHVPDAVESGKADQVFAGSRPRTSQTIVTPRITGRQAHERTSLVIRKTDQKSKRHNAKIDAGAAKYQAAAEPKGCQLEEFDAVRWTLNLPTGCHIQPYPSRGV